jgi:large subunit ribosomal protein L24
MATIKKGDLVQVITGGSQERGGDRGKQGKVISIDKKSNRVIVEGINLVKKHVKVVVRRPVALRPLRPQSTSQTFS